VVESQSPTDLTIHSCARTKGEHACARARVLDQGQALVGSESTYQLEGPNRN
jgi:hypothetical protein